MFTNSRLLPCVSLGLILLGLSMNHASADCDNKCRERYTFNTCEGQSYCVYYTMAVCTWCVDAYGACDPTTPYVDDSHTDYKCTDVVSYGPPLVLDPQAVYAYLFDGCTMRCDCV